MKILVINTGSSSIKYKLFDMEKTDVIASGVVEKIGSEKSIFTHTVIKGADNLEFKDESPAADHRAGLMKVAAMLTDEKYGSIKSFSEISAVGHRVVHGGEDFKQPSIITPQVLDAIRKNIPLAPLHNPANLTGIEVAMNIFSGAKQVAVFDTSFHQTMPEYAFLYAIPYALYEESRVRKYGFHGSSHKFVSAEAADYMGRPASETKIITVHLGNGSSMAAVNGGKCIDTTMGLTPLAGLIMGTRCGDLDPAVNFFLAKNKGMSIDEIDSMLNKKSGLLGICGQNDMREIVKQMDEGCVRSKLALDMLAYQIKKYIGAYFAAMGGLDAVVFTAGIGENSCVVRELAMDGLQRLGMEIDKQENSRRVPGCRDIGAKGSRVRILIIPTNEELQIAREASSLLGDF